MNKLCNIFQTLKAPLDLFRGEFLKFRSKIRALKTWQKVLLISIAVFVPAGIAIATFILLKMKAKRQ